MFDKIVIIKDLEREHQSRDTWTLLIHVLAELHLINKKIDKMSTQNDELQALVDKIIASQAKVRADIAKLAASLPTEGGLTADETAALKAKLQGVADEEDAQDALTPDAPAPEPTV